MDNPRILTVQVRVINASRALSKRLESNRAIIIGGPDRIGSLPLADLCVYSHKDEQRLYCATSKTQLMRIMPA